MVSSLEFDRMKCLSAARKMAADAELYYDGWWTAVGHAINGEIVAAVFFTLGESEADIRAHVVAKPGARWLTSGFVRAVFRYPFVQCNMRRVTAAAASEPLRTMLKLLGFTQEGIKRQAANGRDVAIFGMLREECRYA